MLTRKELATALGCDPRTIAKWQEQGLPVAQRGRGGRPSRYDEAACRAWKGEHDQSPGSPPSSPGQLNAWTERARKDRAQAMLAEQTFQMRMRELVPREEVRKIWASEVAAVRTRLLALPVTLPDQIYRIAALEGLAGIERVLEQAIHDALRELAARGRPVPGIDEEEPVSEDTENAM